MARPRRPLVLTPDPGPLPCPGSGPPGWTSRPRAPAGRPGPVA